MSPDAQDAALDLLGGLVMEDGRTWAASATAWQVDDARAVLDPATSRRHFLLRGRGMSKTTDIGGVVLALLLAAAPPRSRSYAYAVDSDQAGLLMDAIAGFVARSSLGPAVEVEARRIVVKATGATLRVESSDGASAFGTKPWLTVVDEIATWPSTPNHRRLWSAITSALPKVPGSRLVVISTAGQPGGLGHEVWNEAGRSRHWRTSFHPGPAPWWSADDVAATRSALTEAEYRRLVLCDWAEGDDQLTSADDIAAAIRAGAPVLEPDRRHSYVAALDVGTRRDLTALAVGHTEERPAGRVTVIDRVMHWRPRPGSPDGRVDLNDVEQAVIRVAKHYRVGRVRFDRMQAEQLVTNLARAGVSTSEYVFSQSGATRLARTLYTALRDRALSLPEDAELTEELQTVRLVETGPGTVKLSNPSGHHDDVLTAVAMVAVDLAEHPASRITLHRLPKSRRRGPHPIAGRRIHRADEATQTTQPREAAAARGVPDVAAIASELLNRPAEKIALNQRRRRP